MKKILAVFAGLTFTLYAFAQAQITTKKEKLSNFPSKITKVVFSGNEFKDQMIAEAVKNSWMISAFEFCTMEQFESLRNNEEYYFLILRSLCDKNDKNTGIAAFTIVKGTKEAETIDDMLEMITLPACHDGIPSEKEATFMPAILNILQELVLRSLSNTLSGISAVTGKLGDTGKMTLYFDREDLDVSDSYIKSHFDRAMIAGEEGTAEDAMTECDSDTAAGYVIAPAEDSGGDRCYVMLIDAKTHELYYYKKNRINVAAGFTKNDLDKIRSTRKKK